MSFIAENPCLLYAKKVSRNKCRNKLQNITTLRKSLANEE
jgi:hypothetical protein